MITPEQLVAESEKLTKLLDDPRFANPAAQVDIMHALNVLAWVNDGESPPMSQMIVDEHEQGLI